LRFTVANNINPLKLNDLYRVAQKNVYTLTKILMSKECVHFLGHSVYGSYRTANLQMLHIFIQQIYVLNILNMLH